MLLLFIVRKAKKLLRKTVQDNIYNKKRMYKDSIQPLQFVYDNVHLQKM